MCFHKHPYEGFSCQKFLENSLKDFTRMFLANPQILYNFLYVGGTSTFFRNPFFQLLWEHWMTNESKWVIMEQNQKCTVKVFTQN